jgi:hypothetical protein
MQDRTLRWFTASTTSGKRSDQSLPRRVMSRMLGAARSRRNLHASFLLLLVRFEFWMNQSPPIRRQSATARAPVWRRM